MIDAWYDIHGLVKIHLKVSEKNSARIVDRLLSSFRSTPVDNSNLQLEFFDAIKHLSDSPSLNAGGCNYSESERMVWDSDCAVKSDRSGKITIYSNKGIDKYVLTLLLMIQMARQHLAVCHAMGIVIEDEAILFPAWKRTGKTGLLNYFLKQEQIKVLGDELMIISRQGEVYNLPYPVIIQHYHATDKPTALGKTYAKNRNIYLAYTIDPFLDYIAKPMVSLFSHISPALGRFIKQKAPERGVTTPLEQIVSADRIINHAKLKKVINLIRTSGGEIEIKPYEYKVVVPEIIGMLYQGELYSSLNVERFLQYWLVLNAFNAAESWQSILLELEQVLEEALMYAECYRATFPQEAQITEIGKCIDSFI